MENSTSYIGEHPSIHDDRCHWGKKESEVRAAILDGFSLYLWFIFKRVLGNQLTL